MGSRPASDATGRDRRRGALLLPAAALFAIGLGFAVRALSPSTGNQVWTVSLLLTGFPVARRTLQGIARRHFASDIVATLAIVTAVILGSPLPGLIVVLMQTGGEALERNAEGRASNAVREMEAMSPRIAHRLGDRGCEDIAVELIARGDRLLVRPGELVPCDAVVVEGHSSLDISRLTGEPVPINAHPGTRLLSGSANGASPLTIQALAPARESQYARIVALVRTAQSNKSPFQRLADRYAVWFTPVTLAACAVTYAASADWQRVLAVLVVATPCPLILAAPVAIIGGINRAARKMIVFRTGGALEELGGAGAAVLDKTGTLTAGRPTVDHVLPAPGWQAIEVLQLAGAVEHHSSHPMARAVVNAVMELGVTLPGATEVAETPGQGITGCVGGREVAAGGLGWITRRYPGIGPELEFLAGPAAITRAFVVVEGRAAGAIIYQDPMRPSAGDFIRDLRGLGIAPLVLLSGDHEPNVALVARQLGMDSAEGGLLSADKAERVNALMRAGHRVLMLGDGTNDAPALSTANVGIALASGGGGITAEAADVVLLTDDPRLLVEAITVSRDTLRIARESVWAGLGLSLVAMGFAAAGSITPTAGALLQEAIDIAVIVNALRASRH